MNPGALVARFKERWQALNQTQKIISALAAVGFLACLIYLGQLLARPTYAPLFSGLEPKEAGNIVEKLKSMKIPYQLADQGGTVKVPESQVYEARIQLASSGVLGGGGMGFELFDQSKLGQTDFEQQVIYQRALQEELRRTIIQLDGVEQARVHLVLPQKSVFITEQGTATASVALKLKPTAHLRPEQVQGVCDLLVGSVEGLEPENVHIIDTEGNVLSDNLKSDDTGAVSARATLEQQEAQRQYEKELEKRVQQMLAKVMGANQTVAMVTADLDFSQRQTTSNTASNPDNLRVSEHTVRESGTGVDAGDPTGAEPNLSYPLNQGGGSSSYDREENTINYQVSTVQETLVDAPGRVRRLSASVVVNDAGGPVDELTVRGIVEAAIGYDQNRGDQVNVTSMPFDDSYQKKVEAEMAQAEEKVREKERIYTYALVGVALLLMIAAVVVLLQKRRQRVAEEVVEDSDEFISVREMEAMEAIEEEQKPKDDNQQKLRDIAKENPQDVAEIIKMWIKE